MPISSVCDRLCDSCWPYFQRFNFPEYNLGLFDQAQSRLCEADFSGGALQQLQAQFVFKLTQLGTQRRLADITRFRCALKMAVFCQRDKIFKVTDVH
jgi:hypothetical protein